MFLSPVPHRCSHPLPSLSLVVRSNGLLRYVTGENSSPPTFNTETRRDLRLLQVPICSRVRFRNRERSYLLLLNLRIYHRRRSIRSRAVPFSIRLRSGPLPRLARASIRTRRMRLETGSSLCERLRVLDSNRLRTETWELEVQFNRESSLCEGM